MIQSRGGGIGCRIASTGVSGYSRVVSHRRGESSSPANMPKETATRTGSLMEPFNAVQFLNLLRDGVGVVQTIRRDTQGIDAAQSRSIGRLHVQQCGALAGLPVEPLDWERDTRAIEDVQVAM